ncbi:MAG: helix-turn-helix domain-containing protein [Oscillospiraceae bacterium]|nr:helix-turn-helix domain-containing protein [Oscillospiraceae bacterium]
MKKESDFNGYNSVFAARLRKIMNEQNKTQKEVADVLGITRQAISQYLDGAVQPNLEKLYKLANYFQVSCDWFVGQSDIKSSDADDVAINKKLGLTQEAIEYLQFINENVDDIESLENELKTINFLLSDYGHSTVFLLEDIAEYLYGSEIIEMCKNAHYHLDNLVEFDNNERKEINLGAHIISNFLKEDDVLNMLLLNAQKSLVKSMEHIRDIHSKHRIHRIIGGYNIKKDNEKI